MVWILINVVSAARVEEAQPQPEIDGKVSKDNVSVWRGSAWGAETSFNVGTHLDPHAPGKHLANQKKIPTGSR